MVRWAIVLFFIAGTAFGQNISAPTKAVLDHYYAQKETNSIDGAWLIDGTVAKGKLDTNVQAEIDLGTNAFKWVEDNSQSVEEASAWVGATSNSLWLLSTNYPAFTTSPAAPHTLAVGLTNLYVCLTNDWVGPGTNWLRAALTEW
jgi:hypothetical protein